MWVLLFFKAVGTGEGNSTFIRHRKKLFVSCNGPKVGRSEKYSFLEYFLLKNVVLC